MGLFFRYGAFDIEEMVGEKIVSTSFGRVAGHGERVPGVGASTARPLRGADRV